MSNLRDCRSGGGGGCGGDVEVNITSKLATFITAWRRDTGRRGVVGGTIFDIPVDLIVVSVFTALKQPLEVRLLTITLTISRCCVTWSGFFQYFFIAFVNFTALVHA